MKLRGSEANVTHTSGEGPYFPDRKHVHVATRRGIHSESSLMFFHIVLTSCSVLPSLDAMTFHEYRERSSAFKRRSLSLSSRVQVGVGLGERDGDLAARRRRLAGALGVVLGCGRLAGVLSVWENRQVSGTSAGSGAVTWV